MDDPVSKKRVCGGSVLCRNLRQGTKETIPSIVDCNDDCFLAPESMIKAVQDFCSRTGQQVPLTIGEIAAVIYNSLAKCYG